MRPATATRWDVGFDDPMRDVEHGGRLLLADPPSSMRSTFAARGLTVDEVTLRPTGSPRRERGARHQEAVAPESRPWPFADAVFDAVLIPDVLAHVIDDRHVIREAARVLRPGGMLAVRVPYRGPLAWLDPPNVYRYISDATRRGPNPPETWGIGWRRHYTRRELDRMLLDAGFGVRRVTGTGIGVAPLLDLVSMLIFRWLLPWEPVYRATISATEEVARVERRVSLGPAGYWLTIVAERLPDAHAGDG